MKKVIIAMMFVILLLTAMVASVAEETAEGGMMVVSTVAEEDVDNDLLFNMYAESLFGYGAPSFYRANHNFSEDMQEFYDFLVTCIKEVAAGERTCTEFTIEKELTFMQIDLKKLIYAVHADTQPRNKSIHGNVSCLFVTYAGYLTQKTTSGIRISI